jgi:hypothetical protein
MIVFTPPAVVGSPAAFALFVQFVAPMVGLTAVIPVVLDGFVELVINLGQAHLAIIIGANGRSCGSEGKESRKRSGCKRSFHLE